MIDYKNKPVPSITLKEEVLENSTSSNCYLNHIEFLRNNFQYLVEYKFQTGQSNPIFNMIQQNLFDKDPFVVYGAGLIASIAFSDQNLYH